MSDEPMEPIDEISKEEYERGYDELLIKADNFHKKQVENAMLAGYTHDVMKEHQREYVTLFDTATKDPHYYAVIASGYKVIKSLNNEFDRLLSTSQFQGGEILSIANTSGSFGGTISTTASMAGIALEIPAGPIPNPLPGKSNEACIIAFSKLDPSLAKSYAEVWETYYGTRADPHRSAMFMMRQVYDHFFELLAPDDAVRSSEYWQEKRGEKPNQIYRPERINYAAFTHIDDPTVANLYASSAKQTGELYNLLNDAHTRGKLNEEQASAAVMNMDKVLKDWIDVIDKKD